MKFYQSEVHSDELGLDVEINGISVESDEGGSGGQLLNTFLLGEPNHLTITLHPPKGAARPPAGAFVIFNINAFGRERTSKPELVYHYEWRQTNPAKPLPATIHAVLPPVVRAGPLSWQAAPKVTLNAQSEAAINALVKRYYAALAAKDAGQLSELLNNSSRDASIALGRPLADIEASQKRRYQQDFADSHWRVKPVDYAHLQYHLCADNRIVAVVNPNGSAPLVSAPDANGSTSEFTVRVALLHGQWTLVL
ncbi:hypothetical protein A0257_16310 [Hymenobacter psoromatis]|nr:hypothetical protein A0257_16310 [Hymenobacter psoromatis]